MLLDPVMTHESVQVLKEVSAFINSRVGQPFDFQTLISDPSRAADSIAINDLTQPFAKVAATVLRRLGGRYAQVAAQLEKGMRLEQITGGLEKTDGSDTALDGRPFQPAQATEKPLGAYFIGSSSQIHAIRQVIETVAQVQSTVLITGESGTGKEMVARAIHNLSPRSDKPFMPINCGAFTETLLESELFGYVRGAFTGATANRKGLFEAADRGTIFLDEIGEMSPTMQVKLLRVLQERKVRPVGAHEEISIDTRVIAATNRDLAAMVKQGSFRKDLFYRVSVIPIELPPLRERVEDIPELVNHFIQKYVEQSGRQMSISHEAMQLLKNYSWPGNIRQLQNAIEFAATLNTSNVIQHDQLSEYIQADDDAKTTALLEAIESAHPQTSDSLVPGTVISQRGLEHGDLLALISKVGVTLLASGTLDETLRQVARLVFEAVPAEHCFIMLKDDASGELRVRAAEMGDRQLDVGDIRISRTLTEEVVNQGRSVLTSTQYDPLLKSGTVTLQQIRNVLAVPLGVGKRIFGMIYADSPPAESRFTEDHLKVLTTLASVAAIRVENARLLEEHLDQERYEREMQLAREIQQRFQPTAPPQIPGYELQGISFPSYEIGGDYYDFITRPDGRLAIALGDVSGKGTSAALLMSSLHSTMRSEVKHKGSTVEVVNGVNQYLTDNTPPNRFVTLFYAELDSGTGKLDYVNAGHNPGILSHVSGINEQLGPGGLPLGIMTDFEYRVGHTQLQPGDVLVIYSDGLVETQNPRGEEFGMLRLQDVIAKNRDRSAAGIRDKIEAALSAFAQGTSAGDDITLVILKRTSE
jgi:phosphoserine phosphatase RsbU/P